MKRLLVFILFSSVFSITQAQNYKFIPDAGLRLDSAAIAHAVMVNDTLFLFYNLKLFTGFSSSAVAISTRSSDWLDLDTTVSYFDYEHYFIRYLMPDGTTYRRFFPDSSGRYLKSKSLTSGTNFVEDGGVRYSLQAEDSVLGVNTFYVDSAGRTHMLYNTTNQARSQCRRAVSLSGDNGTNFSFADQSPFGDYGRSTPYAFVDPNAIRNPNGSTTIFLMNQQGTIQSMTRRTGHIHSFTTSDYETFKKDVNGADTTLIDYPDFDSESMASYGGAMVHSLNDPKCVILPDGRYRIYSTALLKTASDTTRWGIVSYTRPGPFVMSNESGHSKFGKRNKVYVSGRHLFIDNRSEAITFTVFNISGIQVFNRTGLTKGLNSFPFSVPKGVYLVRIDQGDGGTFKILVGDLK